MGFGVVQRAVAVPCSMPLNPEQFYLLYVNVNSLAELRLRQWAGVASSAAINSRPALPVNELAEQFDGLDLSALDGLDELIRENELSATDVAMASGHSLADSASSAESEAFDIDRYMMHAYGAVEPLRPRLQSHYFKVDVDAIESLLSNLPTHLPALTTHLSGDHMSRWLALANEDHDRISDLIVRIRQLDV